MVENVTTIATNLVIAKSAGGFFNFLNKFFDLVFGWLISWNPLFGLIVISVILTFLVTLAYKYLTNQTLMKDLKDKLKDYQKQMKESKHDQPKMMEIQKQAMELNMKYMLQSFKPTIYTLLPLILIFNWLRLVYQGIDLNFLWFIHNWIWVYILISIAASMLLRKLLKVH
ncbi:MAG: DUF106 domain-containing protein [Candidatus Woesearchaeota archaeon]|nr:MAG: DUF106 domain-containing protein [Candidatus Woesearchaeota archaeon]